MTHPDSPPVTGHLAEARGWLLDCGFDDELVDDLTDPQIVRFVDSEYDGGWPAFLLATVGVDQTAAAPDAPTRSTSLTVTEPVCLAGPADDAVAAPSRIGDAR
ncbi:hypothetical protein HQ346_16865 [Rhodococcus sp. BP-252]|uniref:hypothetical protein n=1 Tax=unclassified Rhodococcus (in: high G+C Gram-positive bacteria) TaxID=192944 RepID=UPI001C9BAE6D|nr:MULTISPECIES: hypothetical protein [unclassified Rhodococcus (in: high G+C Gram-positive bacteria)]MBY6413368.1 hypothetical protein [Rhodococcus sp. BP-320]MBY6418028.1 hypothetical protein [Rhodococcus sp. BP-321]MBY6422282.1 hypothetical protein [Rhodococcus sp. BP-324]MBY6428077.1 hypothetical protein [Rhodococcus sp. BP-323]MBY6433289.1 hypothetical protein [Rhodococcus sp. BP-322]